MNKALQPAFFRESPLSVRKAGVPVLVFLATGFSKPVDPLTGMTVNLSRVIQWQEAFQERISEASFISWVDFFRDARIFFTSQAEEEGAELTALQIRFFNGNCLRQDDKDIWFHQVFTVIDQDQVKIARSRTLYQADEDLEVDAVSITEKTDPQTGISVFENSEVSSLFGGC